jgi:hypothetical protein
LKILWATGDSPVPGQVTVTKSAIFGVHFIEITQNFPQRPGFLFLTAGTDDFRVILKSGREMIMKLSLKPILLSGALALMLPAAAQAQTIHQRKENQQDRIAQGVKSGELTPRETARLEHKEAKLNRETRRMRAANGGTLTPAEKAKVTRQQNHLSRDIYHQKHDAQHQ